MKNIPVLDTEAMEPSKDTLFTSTIFLFVGLCLFIADYKVNNLLGHYKIIFSIVYCLITIPLLLRNYWPRAIKKGFAIYWHLSLTYFLPFFFTYGYFENPDSNLWSIAMLGSYIALTMLVQNKLLWPCLFAGSFFGLICSDPYDANNTLPENFGYVVTSAFGVVIYCSYLLSQFEQSHKEKLALVENLGGSIAHELRTPLAAVSLAADGIKNNLSQLIEAYDMAQKNFLKVPKIDPLALENLKSSPEDLQNTCQVAQNTINMLLLNLKTPRSIELSPTSAKASIEDALNDYPFYEHEKSYVALDVKKDFNFMGNEAFMKHVVFNFLKNALYYLRTSAEKRIKISIYTDGDTGHIKFRDTGPGITPEHIPYIFDKFYSMRNQGTGLGLSFCKYVVESFDGEINCDSIEGQYTEFHIELPITTKAIRLEKD